MPRKKKSAAAREAANAAYGSAAAATGKSHDGKIAQLLEFLPQLGQEAATILLHSHDYDVQAAVAAHVNGDGTLDEWSTNTSKPKSKKEPQHDTSPGAARNKDGVRSKAGSSQNGTPKISSTAAQPSKQPDTTPSQAPQLKKNLNPQVAQPQGNQRKRDGRVDGGDKGASNKTKPAKQTAPTSAPTTTQNISGGMSASSTSNSRTASGMRKIDINTLMRNNPSVNGGMVAPVAVASMRSGQLPSSSHTMIASAGGLSPAAEKALASLDDLQKVMTEKWTEAHNDSTQVLNTLQAEVNRRRIQLVQSMSLARSTEAALIQKRRHLLLSMAQSGLDSDQTTEMIEKFDEATRADLPKWRTKRFQHNVSEVQSAILSCGSFVDVSAIPANTPVAVAAPTAPSTRGNSSSNEKTPHSSNNNNSNTTAAPKEKANNPVDSHAKGGGAQQPRAQRKPRRGKRGGKSAASTD
eukprot:m.508620 g.508620  ORF g.508620 m.508620 type:complete len:465 (+) comp21883_c0_seq3:64-1458(+)